MICVWIWLAYQYHTCQTLRTVPGMVEAWHSVQNQTKPEQMEVCSQSKAEYAGQCLFQISQMFVAIKFISCLCLFMRPIKNEQQLS